MIETERLRLRPWRQEDRPAFAAMCGDPEVMRHFAKTLSRSEADEFLDRMDLRQAETGLCFWAVERLAIPGAIGMCGLVHIQWAAIPFETEMDPPVEIGWRFATAHQGQGYALEAARAALAHGFSLDLPEIVAFTIPPNTRSWRLMEKLGMRPDGRFEHPRLPEGHPMREHLLYRLRREHRP
jgi:RimJ/RimL family protein N-acetyltransferase